MEKTFASSAQSSKTNFLCVRYGNVAWSTGSVPIWKEMFEKINYLYNGLRRFFSVEEAVNLVTVSLNNKNSNGRFYLLIWDLLV